MKIEKKIKITAIASFSIVLLVVLIYFIGKAVGKNKKTAGSQSTLPADTNWGSSLSSTESEEIARHAKALYDDMKGVNFWTRDISIYTNYLATSDRVFVGVANYFYDKYGSGENLAQWINSEVWGWSATANTDVINSIVERLNKFKIYA